MPKKAVFLFSLLSTSLAWAQMVTPSLDWTDPITTSSAGALRNAGSIISGFYDSSNIEVTTNSQMTEKTEGHSAFSLLGSFNSKLIGGEIFLSPKDKREQKIEENSSQIISTTEQQQLQTSLFSRRTWPLLLGIQYSRLKSETTQKLQGGENFYKATETVTRMGAGATFSLFSVVFLSAQANRVSFQHTYYVDHQWIETQGGVATIWGDNRLKAKLGISRVHTPSHRKKSDGTKAAHQVYQSDEDLITAELFMDTSFLLSSHLLGINGLILGVQKGSQSIDDPQHTEVDILHLKGAVAINQSSIHAGISLKKRETTSGITTIDEELVEFRMGIRF